MNTDTRVVPGWQFASDNTAGVCPEAWAAMQAANQGYAASYGSDPWTQRSCELVRSLFERPSAFWIAPQKPRATLQAAE